MSCQKLYVASQLNSCLNISILFPLPEGPWDQSREAAPACLGRVGPPRRPRWCAQRYQAIPPVRRGGHGTGPPVPSRAT